jgi:hypothetical protein
VPVCSYGELFIGGAGVTRGYLDRHELTAERFVTDLGGGGASRLYATGDVGRWTREGVLEFAGRTDQQVKLLGHRIELSEIETSLSRHEGVAAAAVVARGSDEDARLIAYVVPAPGASPGRRELRDHVAASLPAWMVPADVLMVDQFPRTPNGKLDRNALPDSIRQHVPSDAPLLPPSNDFERWLVALWQEVLGVDQIGVDQNFFDLGGHSLLAVRVYREICAFAPSDPTLGTLALADIFRFTTVRGLAQHLAGAPVVTAEADAAHARGITRRRALSRREPAAMEMPTGVRG